MIKKKTSEFHQLYNEDWEKLSIFQGWLSSVKTSKFRAYCKYCKKEFRAHRTDLRTHAHSRKHQKSADAYYENEENLITVKDLPLGSKSKSPCSGVSSVATRPEEDEPVIDESDESTGSGDCDDVLTIQELQSGSCSNLQDSAANNRLPESSEVSASGISTQVLDLVKGSPVSRLVVYLFVHKNDQWVKLGKGFTEKNGFCSRFVPTEGHEEVSRLSPGQYQLRFDTKMYYTLNLEETLFPFIVVPIEISDIGVHHSVKLLISPYSYMVFRGS